jgi:hypothetical protein
MEYYICTCIPRTVPSDYLWIKKNHDVCRMICSNCKNIFCRVDLLQPNYLSVYMEQLDLAITMKSSPSSVYDPISRSYVILIE